MKPIPNFSRYIADELGNIYSTNYKRSGKTVILKPAISTDGYLKTVLLSDSGKYKTIAVHREIARTFLGSHTGLDVNHKNGIKTDNRLENLEYITHAANVQHSFDLGLQKPQRGSLNGMSKLTEQDVREIREYAKSNRVYRRVLSERYGVSIGHIKDIVTKRRNIWPHI